MIPRLESGTQYWSWRTLAEFELGKYAMPESNQVATLHQTLGTTVRTNLHGRHQRLWECWRKLAVPQAFELIRDASSAPSKVDYARAILENARQRQGKAAISFFDQMVKLMRWAQILDREDAFPSRVARIRLWEAFYKGLSSDCGLRENIRFMSTFHQWTISECQAVVREFESFGQPKATAPVTNDAEEEDDPNAGTGGRSILRQVLFLQQTRTPPERLPRGEEERSPHRCRRGTNGGFYHSRRISPCGERDRER